MGKTIGLVMAKASRDDIDGAFDLACIFDAIGKGEYPSYFATPEDRDAAEDAGNIPTFFDADNIDHLQHLHGLLTDLYERRRGFSLWRLAMNMDTILRNDILDPDVDHLAIHPKFALREQELAFAVALLRNALAGIIGERDPDQLRGMEAFLRSQSAPDQDKTAAINAIHALLATMPAPAAEVSDA